MQVICKYKDMNEDKLRAQLCEAGLKATPARLAVMALLQRHQKPISVQTVMAKLKRVDPDQVTVYRILSSLVQAELVREVYVEKGISSYEIADRPHHHHLICEKCGFVEDVTACCDDPKPVAFRTVTHHNLEFMGICEKCAGAA
jgi:Fe2+ or Zn2+ uptake regulation protein